MEEPANEDSESAKEKSTTYEQDRDGIVRCLGVMAAQLAILLKPKLKEHGPTLGSFLKHQPPSFSGKDQAGGLVDKAVAWLAGMDEIWEVFECPDERKTIFAAHKLSGAARTWWENLSYFRTSKEPLLWKDFKTRFEAHYIHNATKKKKAEEFIRLQQGNFVKEPNDTHNNKRKAKVFKNKNKKRLCRQCGKYHFGTCHVTFTCYLCKEKGHIKKFCPQLRKEQEEMHTEE